MINLLDGQKKKYGGRFCKVKAHQCKTHSYLGMAFIYNESGEVIVDMKDYVKNMLEEFPVKFKMEERTNNPATLDMFERKNEKRLTKEKAEIFHRTVAKGLFLSKRARLDIQPIIACLCTRVKDPTEGDWNKLVKMMKYLHSTREMTLTMSA